jgi:hypothetical protein
MSGFAADLAAIANDAGLSFTAHEFLDAASSATAELSEAQLEGIAGGKIAQSDVPDNMLSLLTALRAT